MPLPSLESRNYVDEFFIPGRGIPDLENPGCYFEVEVLVSNEDGDWVSPTEPVFVRRTYQPTFGLSGPLRGTPEPLLIAVSPSRSPSVEAAENATLAAALKLPAGTIDWSPGAFDGVVASLRVLRQACGPAASRSTLDFAHGKTVEAGMALMDWAAGPSSRASLIQALRSRDPGDAVDASAAMFLASMQEYDVDEGDELFKGARHVVGALQPNADGVAASLDRVEGRNADGTLRSYSGEDAVTWRMASSRLPKLSRFLLLDIGLEGRGRVID